MMLTSYPRGTVVVPVHATGAIEYIARRHDGRVIRTRANPTALMETCQTNENVVLGGSADMGFIFPEMHPGFDAMFSIAKLIELLTVQEHSLGQIWSELPRISHREQTLRCPWTVKGALMRYLVETHPADKLELIDGVKILGNHPHDWVLVLPDAGEPLVHIYATSEEREWLDAKMREYQERVQLFIEKEQGIKEGTI